MAQSKINIDDLLTNHSAENLRLFSKSANKSTKHSHPCDKDMWLEFIMSTFYSNMEIDATDLQQFLIEDGWSEDAAFDLACDYEYSIVLLKYNSSY